MTALSDWITQLTVRKSVASGIEPVQGDIGTVISALGEINAAIGVNASVSAWIAQLVKLKTVLGVTQLVGSYSLVIPALQAINTAVGTQTNVTAWVNQLIAYKSSNGIQMIIGGAAIVIAALGQIQANYPYHANAVDFGGAAWLLRAGGLIGVVDAPFGLSSVWVKSSDWFNTANGADGAFFIGPSFNATCLDGGQALNGAQFSLRNAAQSSNFQAVMNVGWASNVWINLLAAWDTNHAAGTKIFQLYISDILFNNLTIADNGAAFNVNYAGVNFFAGGGTDNDPVGPGPIGSQADFYFNPNPAAFYDLSIIANRRKFIDGNGKPVFLGADGSTPTGVAPAVFFSGNAASYATNKGPGGAFALTGGPLTNAASSPSD